MNLRTPVPPFNSRGHFHQKKLRQNWCEVWFWRGNPVCETNLFHLQEADSLGHKNRQISCTKFLVTQLSDKMSLPQKWMEYFCYVFFMVLKSRHVLFSSTFFHFNVIWTMLFLDCSPLKEMITAVTDFTKASNHKNM